MKKNAIYSIVILFVLIISGCSSTNLTESKSKSTGPRNVILFIGDGMGVAQVYAGMTLYNQTFSLEKFPYSGFSKTYSANNYITDSAAGGTAIACGTKTNNGMIGVKPDSSAVSSILEIAHKNGLATGVVSTSSVTHATPASFVAHNAGRGNYDDIAKDFLKGTVDVFIGGGSDNFKARKDNVDLTEELKKQGFRVVYSIDELKNANSNKIAGLLAKFHMPKESEGRGEALKEMTMKAIETLSKNKNGFFLMVEGSMIDFGCHAKDFDFAESEMLDLNKAIDAARDFAANDGNTLVVVTADHETGGLTLNGGSMKEHKVTEPKFSGGEHTAVMVPIFSFGPDAEKFSGIHENTFFKNEFLNFFGIK